MQKCPHCASKSIRKKNFYIIKHSQSKIRRYLCQDCRRTFSSKTFSPIYRQTKPFLNMAIFKLLVSGNTQRRTAKLIHCSKNTVAQKLLWLSQFPETISKSGSLDNQHLQIDELETIEHTKLKPVTIPICVNHKYKILGLTVGRIKAKGLLSEIALKKYGRREDEREKSLNELFEKLKKEKSTDPETITTDANPLYPKLIRKYYPKSKHIQVVSRDVLKKKRELMYTAQRKKIFDPLFVLNQRCAMLRSDLRRLTRRSWCTTKKIENLEKHLQLYMVYNNEFLT